ncbi:hypothetical protein DFH09DRAFT_1338420 [Mycena vulgaris]|nr:hypothetical protein DFH09DRAFT_1338420 [Mycena vulgaris]
MSAYLGRRPSADAQYKSVSGATIKGYRHWNPLESAWFAACDRGEHNHSGEAGVSCPPATPVWQSLPPATQSAPSAIQAGPVVKGHKTSSTSPRTSPRPSPFKSQSQSRVARDAAGVVPVDFSTLTLSDSSPPTSHNAAVDAIRGKMVYAVKDGGRGAVFNEYSGARDLYHRLEADGGKPTLASCASLTEGVSFVEGFSIAGSSTEAGARRQWIEEELTGAQPACRRGLGEGDGYLEGWARRRLEE